MKSWSITTCFYHDATFFQNDVRSQAEESQYLRESLKQTKDKLDQEKRLNTAIKQRKV